MRLVFIGTGEIGLPVLQSLLGDPRHEIAGIVTQPDKPAGRQQELLASPIKQLALQHAVPVYQPLKIRAAGAVEPLRAWEPDLIMVMAYGQILPRELLILPRLSCWNIHASLLPRHRGAAPIQAAILAGDRESGITIMYVDEGLDTGDILLKKTLPIRRRETGGSLHDRLAALAPTALHEALTLLSEGRAPRLPQEKALATYAPKLEREHGELAWSDSAQKLDAKIRAFNPWPSACTWLRLRQAAPQKLKVFSAIRIRRSSGQPGEILRANENGLLVATGNSEALLLRDLQLEGKKRMPAGEFLRGNSVVPGEFLGRP